MDEKNVSDLEMALSVLSEAEEALSTLMREGLADQRYDDVAAVAEVTQLLTDLIGSLANPAQEDRERGPSKPRQSYPQFAKDGDRLVKVGWSGKNRQEYEHRTHRRVIWVFARVVRDRAEPADCFTMEDVLPLVYAGGKEIPSYQAYLVLAWLRSVEAITKDGRNGYRADVFKLSDESLKSLWESLPEHA